MKKKSHPKIDTLKLKDKVQKDLLPSVQEALAHRGGKMEIKDKNLAEWAEGAASPKKRRAG